VLTLSGCEPTRRFGSTSLKYGLAVLIVFPSRVSGFHSVLSLLLRWIPLSASSACGGKGHSLQPREGAVTTARLGPRP